MPGVKQRITVQVADPAQQRWGFELTARLNSDLEKGQAGDLVPVDNMTQVICEDSAPKPCASGPQFITHTSAGTRNGTPNGASFQFDWTPPATNAGPVTLYAAGNAANGNGTPTGDQIYTTSMQLTPVVAAAPTVTAGNIVSSATGVAGPIAANSWVTIYGTNLCATTRGWLDSDFMNGGMPFSVEGVSVILNVNNTPRVAYVGYVSPTQVNFLMPSNAGVGRHHGTSQESCGNQRPCDDYGGGRRAAVVYRRWQERVGRSRGRRVTRQRQSGGGSGRNDFALRHGLRRNDSCPDSGRGAGSRLPAGHASAGDHRRRRSDGVVRRSGSRHRGRVPDQRAGSQPEPRMATCR